MYMGSENTAHIHASKSIICSAPFAFDKIEMA